MIFDIINDYNKSNKPLANRGKLLTDKESLAHLVVPVASDLINKKATLDSCYHENMEFFTDVAIIKWDKEGMFDIDENDHKTSKVDKAIKKSNIRQLKAIFSYYYNQGCYSSYNSDVDVLDYMSYKRNAINNMIRKIPLIRHNLIKSKEFYSLITYLIKLVQSELIRDSIDENTNSHLITTAEEPIVIKDFSDKMLNTIANIVMNVVCQALKSDSNSIKISRGK